MRTINTHQFVAIIESIIASGLHQPVLGLGAPGIGKSEIVQQIADKHGYRVIDLRLAQMREEELAGLIFPTEDKTRAQWLLPDWFPRAGEQKAVLLLDELTSATKRIQVAAYQLVLDRKLGPLNEKSKLPDDTVIIALGNREDDNGVYVELAAPLANRFEIYDIEPDYDIWLQDYAQKYVNPKTGKGFNPTVIAYLNEHKSQLHASLSENADTDENEMIFASPRSWNRVSDILNLADGKIDDITDLRISGCIGESAGRDFVTYARNFSNITVVQDIIAGADPDVPRSNAAKLYVFSSLTSAYNSETHNAEMPRKVELYLAFKKYADKMGGEYPAFMDSFFEENYEDVIIAAAQEDNTQLFKDIKRELEFSNKFEAIANNREEELEDADITTLATELAEFSNAFQIL